MKIDIVSFTKKGGILTGKLVESLPDAEGFCIKDCAEELGLRPLATPLFHWVQERFTKGGALVFVGAVGIAVRAIAPFVEDKTRDPAVVAIDEQGEYVIPLLSGHLGGANELARQLAKLLKATPIITTATDLNGVFAVDNWAKREGVHIVNPEEIKHISAALLKGTSVGLSTEYPVVTELPQGVVFSSKQENGIVMKDNPQKMYPNSLLLIPKRFILGIGCRKGIDNRELEEKVLTCLKENRFSINSLQAVASIDLKKEESAILHFTKKYEIPFFTYSAQALGEVKGAFSASQFVKKTVGVDNVCERACCFTGGKLVLNKQNLGGVTLAVAEVDYCVRF